MEVFVVRHAKATTVSVAVEVGDRLRVEVSDDGIGIPPEGRRSGLLNLAERAGALGGHFEAEPRPADGGSRLVWEVPLD